MFLNYPAEALRRKLPAYVITCNCDVIGEVLQKITMSTFYISTGSYEDFQPFDLSISFSFFFFFFFFFFFVISCKVTILAK